MRTRSDISTISYNSVEFLQLKLQELIDNHTISDYMYIYHFKEQDEKKDHIHLFIRPNKLIDTMDLQTFFREVDIHHDLPLGCIDFRPSKIDDWILYNTHDVMYLRSKFEVREFHYSEKDFFYNDLDTFTYNYRHAFYGSDWALQRQVLNFLDDVRNSPSDLVFSGCVDLKQSGSLLALKSLQEKYPSVFRNGHEGHEDNEYVNSDINTVGTES